MIAISYRREDSMPIAGRLYDRLQAKFGKQSVFMDFDSIPPGVDFRERIKQTIERSDLVVAVIGPQWLGEQSDGSRRIDDPTDFVRLEIEYALKGGIPVIPLLVNSTPMPKPETLPSDIQALAFRNALPLDSGLDFHSHADRLINGIGGLIDVDSRQDGAGAEARKLTSRESNLTTRRGKFAVSAFLALATAISAFWLYNRSSSRVVSGEATHAPPIEANRPANPQPSASETIAPKSATSPAELAFGNSNRTPTSSRVSESPGSLLPNARRLFAGLWRGELRSHKYDVPAQLSINETETVVILTYNPDEKTGWSHGRVDHIIQNWSHKNSNELTAVGPEPFGGSITIRVSENDESATLVMEGGYSSEQGVFHRERSVTAPSANLMSTITPAVTKPTSAAIQPLDLVEDTALNMTMAKYLDSIRTRSTHQLLALFSKTQSWHFTAYNIDTARKQASEEYTYKQLERDLSSKKGLYWNFFTDDTHGYSYRLEVLSHPFEVWRKIDASTFRSPSSTTVNYVRWRKEQDRWVVSEIADTSP